MATITGTTGDDKYPNEVEGTSVADQIFGLAGNDTLIGFNGDDELEGGTGADELFGSNGLDYASGAFTFLTLVLSAELWACRDGGRE